jgi:hypothetical protein
MAKTLRSAAAKAANVSRRSRDMGIADIHALADRFGAAGAERSRLHNKLLRSDLRLAASVIRALSQWVPADYVITVDANGDLP